MRINKKKKLIPLSRPRIKISRRFAYRSTIIFGKYLGKKSNYLSVSSEHVQQVFVLIYQMWYTVVIPVYTFDEHSDKNIFFILNAVKVANGMLINPIVDFSRGLLKLS